MPVHLVPQRTDIGGQGTLVVRLPAERPLRVLAAALLAFSIASAPSLVRAASTLSDGSVTPTSGTTATTFTFSVDYTSTGSPTRPAQAVWAQVGGVTATLVKVSGSAHDGTWRGTATLPAGTWLVTFHATTSSDPQPEPLPGPMVTVTQPPPTPTPSPTPQPTATSAPPTPAPTPAPPTRSPSTNPTPRPLPTPQLTPPPIDGDDATRGRTPSPSPTPSASGSARSRTPAPTPTPTADEDDVPAETPTAPDPADDAAATPPESMLASFLIVGGTLSLAGAAVLARQWFVLRRARPH